MSDWGWARATITNNSSTAAATGSSTNSRNGSSSSSSEGPPSKSANPFAGVQLRKTNSRRRNNQQQQQEQEQVPKLVTVNLILDDEEFAPQHLRFARPIPLTYDAQDTHLVCMANAWHDTTTNTTGAPDDLTSLSHLHEPAVVYCLSERYKQDCIYTYTGKVLLALNPFRPVGNVYGLETMQKYWNYALRGSSGIRPPPHVYALAEDAYRNLLRSLQHPFHSSGNHSSANQGQGQDQSILVSGESGAGKTVTTKIVLQYLTTLSQQGQSSSSSSSSSHQHANCNNKKNNNTMEAQVLQSNPILESFGNARTVRNDNSSRFGKFLQLQFNARGTVTSASITTYLLEKVRLITQTEGERNYHIFYELLAGVTQGERHALKIGNFGVMDFRMTNTSGTYDRRDGVGDRETYKELRQAFNTVGFSQDEQMDLFRVASCLLHASNITFQPHKKEGHDGSELELSNPSLRSAVDLLGVSVMALNAACCRLAIEARGETLYKNLSKSQAEKAMEALIKATYQGLFTYIVQRINSFITVRHDGDGGDNHNLSPKQHAQSNSDATASIGVLDIFGFESFEENSFEQLCINFCNEALQQQFNKFVFKHEQEMYQQEGIEWSFIEFPDNQDVLDLIEKKRDGIISVLDEQCRLPRCTDNTFARALYDKCGEHDRFFASKTQQSSLTFSIQHYAGLVEYSAIDFLEKNKDELPKETTELLLNSSNPFVVALGGILQESASTGNTTAPNKSLKPGGRSPMRSPNPRNNGSSLLRESVGSQFCTQLRDLRARIGNTAPHYIRCLKPNDDLIPYNFQPLVIADQLRCAGVLEAIRVSRVGFPHRYSHEDFVDLYSVLCRTELTQLGKGARGREVCEILVDCLVPPIQSFLAHEGGGEDVMEHEPSKSRQTFLGLQMGRSKVFIRPKTFEALELLRGQKIELAAIKIQSVVRMFLSTIRYEISQIATIIIQTAIRRFVAARRCRKMRYLQKAVTIQNAWRGCSARRKLRSALVIARFAQSTLRGAIARECCIILLLDSKASIIQRSWKHQRRNQKCDAMNFRRLRSCVVSIQTCYRRQVAKVLLKQLKAEAKDLICVAHERDKLREETRRLREELEQAKQDAENRAKPSSKEVEVQQLKMEVMKLRAELQKAKQMTVSPTLSHADELGFLAREMEQKELQLKGLRRDLYGASPAASKDSSFALHNSFKDEKTFRDEKKVMEHHSPPRMRRSPTRSPPSSISLLDADNPNEGFLDQSHKSCEHSNAYTNTTISLSSSMNTANLRGEAFFLELRRLHDAIRAGDLDLVETILRQSSQESHILISEGDETGRTALHVAALTSNVLITRTLLDNGAIANAQDNDGETPLHLAETAAMTSVLLKEGRANPNIPNIDGICALHLAVQRRDLDSVRALMLNNANVNAADNVRWFTPLHLIALPARTDVEKFSGEGDVRARIAELMSGGATSRYEPDLNYQDSEGNCPIHYAVQLTTPDAYDLIRIYLENGADPKILNNRSQSALHLICHNNNLRRMSFYPEALQRVLNRGGDPNQQSAAGCTALHLSVYHRDIDSAVELVANGAQLHPLWKKVSI